MKKVFAILAIVALASCGGSETAAPANDSATVATPDSAVTAPAPDSAATATPDSAAATTAKPDSAK